MIRDLYPEYTENSYNFTIKKQTRLKHGQRTWIGISPNVHKWLITMRKDAQHQGKAYQTTIRYCLIPVRMVIIKNKTKTENKYQWGYGEIGNLVHCWWECKMVQSLWKTAWSFLKKIKNRTVIWTSNPTSDIYPKDLETGFRRNICTTMGSLHHYSQ